MAAFAKGVAKRVARRVPWARRVAAAERRATRCETKNRSALRR
ncbi:MAG: hypothetical protein AVDCRST_MAG71-2096 [uncultured Lysobacter sp.]|uniref:Uncharacterized protein n=1 Tax=uncultured Lysobacter sp. TaxID=271060 RepID=A0A6J4LNM4_9GAMM|nr:MAG: hypothetical protein AVDCRST_MAG71-2096 [uncultured Lysobacter sp.]